MFDEDAMQRALDVSDKEKYAAELDKRPEKKIKPPVRDIGAPLDKDEVLAKIGRGAKGKDGLGRFAAALKGIEAPYLKRVNWVANHLHIPLTDIESDEPPDYASICLLKWANDNEDEFRTTYDSRLMPTKQELANMDKLKDDGRGLPWLDAFEENFYAEQSAAGHSSEHQVPPASDRAGQPEQASA